MAAFNPPKNLMVDLCMPVLRNTPTARCWKLDPEHKDKVKKNESNNL